MIDKNVRTTSNTAPSVPGWVAYCAVARNLIGAEYSLGVLNEGEPSEAIGEGRDAAGAC